MTYGSLLQSRLGLNFDTTKFGSGIDPYGDLQTRLQKQTKLIRDNTSTIYTAIANSSVTPSTYFQNPVASILSTINTTINNAYTLVWNYAVDLGEAGLDYILRPVVPTLPTTYNSLVQELTTDDTNLNGSPKAFNTFISHTNRLSNLSNSNKENRPSFSSAQSILQTIQSLIYQLETTSTNTVGSLGLGAFTSLFINSDLSTYNSNINSNYTNLQSLLSTNPTSTNPTINSGLSSLTTNMENLLTLLVTRREHDENFYLNAISIGEDFNVISTNKNYSTTSSMLASYLVENLIGTNTLKNL